MFRYVLPALLAGALGLLPHVADAQVSTLYVLNEATGQEHKLVDADIDFSVSVLDNQSILITTNLKQWPPTQSIVPSTPRWQLSFRAEPGHVLAPGFYPDAACSGWDQPGRVPRMIVTNDDEIRICYDDEDNLYGWFSIRQLEFGPDGQVSKLDVAFTQRMGSATTKGRTGFFRYNTGAHSFAVRSSRKSPWGARDELHMGDTTFFNLWGTPSSFHHRASAIKGFWTTTLRLPQGQVIAPGKYSAIEDIVEGNVPTFSAVNGHGYWQSVCLRATGLYDRGKAVFDIKQIRYDDAGALVSLHAVVEISCFTDKKKAPEPIVFEIVHNV